MSNPDQLTARDMFLMSVLPAIAQGVMEGLQGTPYSVLDTTAEMAPEIAACARRIADAVMDERQLKPVGVK